MNFPWDAPPKMSVEETIAALQRDFAYAVSNTAVVVHSNNELFRLVANTKRGQLVPRGEVKFTDGTTVELQDIGMCQPGEVPHMTVQEIMQWIWDVADLHGLELSP